MPCMLTTIYALTFLKPSTMYRPRCSEMLSGLCSAFGTYWVVQCHPSIESNPRISTTEHVHALYFLSHIGCTVPINRVKTSPKKCHSIGWKRSCDNQKFNRKEYFTKSQRVFQTRGSAPGAPPPPPLKLEDIWFFTRNTPNIFAPPSARRNFLSAPPPPNLKSWILPCRRQQFGIYWPDNSHLSIIIKYAKVVILSVV